MEFREKTFWNMEKKSISYLSKNESAWIARSVIAATVTLLIANANDLTLAIKAQKTNNTGGHVAQKNQTLKTFIHKIHKLGRKLSFYAKRNGDKVLQNDVDIPESDLLFVSEDGALLKCNTIISRGKEYLSMTSEYGVTAKDLDELTAELTRIEQMYPNISLIANERMSAGRSIKELISEARDLLDQLDDAFEGMIEDEDFKNGWFAIRKIKGRHKNKGIDKKVLSAQAN
jgi:hypothetical protein